MTTTKGRRLAILIPALALGLYGCSYETTSFEGREQQMEHAERIASLFFEGVNTAIDGYCKTQSCRPSKNKSRSFNFSASTSSGEYSGGMSSTVSSDPAAELPQE